MWLQWKRWAWLEGGDNKSFTHARHYAGPCPSRSHSARCQSAMGPTTRPSDACGDADILLYAWWPLRQLALPSERRRCLLAANAISKIPCRPAALWLSPTPYPTHPHPACQPQSLTPAA